MKGFFSIFTDSAKELKKPSTLAVTGMFIAVSMIIETFTIEIPFSKISFAFLAIAIIGMLFGPTVAFLAGGVCDVVGFMVHPVGSFLPIFTLLAMLQGLIYGIILYRKRDKFKIIVLRNSDKKEFDITLILRAIVARLLDIFIINIFLNTAALMHYHFIPQKSYSAAIVGRITKNVIELIADIPLMIILLPIALVAFMRVFKNTKSKTN